MNLIIGLIFIILIFYKCYLAAITLGVSILAFYFFRKNIKE